MSLGLHLRHDAQCTTVHTRPPGDIQSMSNYQENQGVQGIILVLVLQLGVMLEANSLDGGSPGLT